MMTARPIHVVMDDKIGDGGGAEREEITGRLLAEAMIASSRRPWPAILCVRPLSNNRMLVILSDRRLICLPSRR